MRGLFPDFRGAAIGNATRKNISVSGTHGAAIIKLDVGRASRSGEGGGGVPFLEELSTDAW